MDPTLLASVFLLAMGGRSAASGRPRRCGTWTSTRTCARAVLGAAIDVIGTLAVVFTQRVLAWHVPAAFPTVALIHRGFAYVATAMLVVQAVGGFRHWRMHPAFGLAFLGVYTVTYSLAVVAYGPWWR